MKLKNIKELLIEIEQDCLKIEEKRELTSYGQGQLDLCVVLLDIIRKC